MFEIWKVAIEPIPINNRDIYNLIIDVDRKPVSEHSGCYNKPSTNEVAVLLVGQYYERRDIVLFTRNASLKMCVRLIDDMMLLNIRLCFVGEDSYNFGIQT